MTIKYKVTDSTREAYEDAIAESSNHLVEFVPLCEHNPNSIICEVNVGTHVDYYGCLEDGLLTLVSEDTDELVVYSISKKEWLEQMSQIFG
jgi:hypothetical protein